MELPIFHTSPSMNDLFAAHLISSYNLIPQNYVHWTQTPQSHIYSAQLPGMRKEEIKVELEDSIYLIIRTITATTEPAADTESGNRSFMRKFRLPDMVNTDEISAGYENGILTVTVPKRILSVDPAYSSSQLRLLARAA